MLLEGLEHKTVEIRFVNARRLFYLLQGVLFPPVPLFLPYNIGSAGQCVDQNWKRYRELRRDDISRTSTSLDIREL